MIVFGKKLSILDLIKSRVTGIIKKSELCDFFPIRVPTEKFGYFVRQYKREIKISQSVDDNSALV